MACVLYFIHIVEIADSRRFLDLITVLLHLDQVVSHTFS